ncbi:MAG TPA: fumarylacetoacetate hydrolase family protein, partial [Phenylobacterium sp.]|nr:fumarylacetoacetate hydrolase family protein [Phenylobacterium sp.]
QNVNGWVQTEADPARKITLCLRLAKGYAEDLGHMEYAQPYYQQVLKLDPNNVQVLRQMANFFKKAHRWQDQGNHLTSALNNAVAEQDRKEILTELGEVLEVRLNEVDQGIAFYKRALDVDPHFVPALEALGRIYEGKGQTRELVETLVAKAKGHPWDASKAFDASAPISALRRWAGPAPQGAIWAKVNGEIRQQAVVSDMIWNVAEIIAQASRLWRLDAGDLIFTGTPEGVGPVSRGDRVEGGVEGVGELAFSVA